MENMTNEELVAGGAILGAGMGVTITFALIFYALVVVAGWKIFTKAGEAGWKSIIPVYNLYVFYKIAKVNFWVWCFIPVVALNVLIQLIPTDGTTKPSTLVAILFLAFLVYAVVGDFKWCKGLSKSFGKGTGFALGLFFLPNIFQLILGFGSSKYEK